ncbi:UNVERIFIED_CONTAM: putative E3 ubiquitin-protein ligase LUL4 [Sesamum angustifolium]|uniref:RING-type E3 ubiquitin transferase n=1 Tax=Sesamum angustifolium TaxID=2727405 RepID=A0AAW2NYE2_9LAMI
MGLSWSKRHHHHQNHHNYPPLPPSSSSPVTPPPAIPTPPRPTSPTHASNPPAQPPSYAFAANAPYSAPQPPEQHPYPAFRPPPPPPPPLPPYNYNYNFSNYYSRPVNNMGQYPNYRPYYIPQISGWGPSVAPLPPPPPPLQPAPYVDHQSAKKIKNDVNVHKDTIRLQVDEQSPDCHLVSFTFDALVDGSITIFYFAKEGDNCRFTPVYPEIVPVKVPFQKGLGQKFCQPSGTGVDLGFFDTDDLSKPVEDIYPLVISAESHGPSMSMASSEELENMSPHAQISQAVLQKKDGGIFQVKVIKQILWIDNARYELREIFGISNSDEAAINDMESGKECIICMTEVKNTAVLPCRHMCMCSDCAKELRIQSNKCPVCRQPIEELLEIKVDEEQLRVCIPRSLAKIPHKSNPLSITYMSQSAQRSMLGYSMFEVLQSAGRWEGVATMAGSLLLRTAHPQFAIGFRNQWVPR